MIAMAAMAAFSLALPTELLRDDCVNTRNNGNMSIEFGALSCCGDAGVALEEVTGDGGSANSANKHTHHHTDNACDRNYLCGLRARAAPWSFVILLDSILQTLMRTCF